MSRRRHPHADETAPQHRPLDSIANLPLFGERPNAPAPHLSEEDLQRLGRAKDAVLCLLVERGDEWTELATIREVGGDSGDRRVRELRSLGLIIEVQRPKNRLGGFRYRIHRDSRETAALLAGKVAR